MTRKLIKLGQNQKSFLDPLKPTPRVMLCGLGLFLKKKKHVLLVHLVDKLPRTLLFDIYTNRPDHQFQKQNSIQNLWLGQSRFWRLGQGLRWGPVVKTNLALFSFHNFIFWKVEGSQYLLISVAGPSWHQGPEILTFKVISRLFIHGDSPLLVMVVIHISRG